MEKLWYEVINGNPEFTGFELSTFQGLYPQYENWELIANIYNDIINQYLDNA